LKQFSISKHRHEIFVLLCTARITILVYMLFGPTNLIYFMKSHRHTVAR